MAYSNIKEYAVNELLDEMICDKKVVELVPIDWLIENETWCFWPPKDQENVLQQLVKLKSGPGKKWKRYPVKLISKASKYLRTLTTVFNIFIISMYYRVIYLLIVFKFNFNFLKVFTAVKY